MERDPPCTAPETTHFSFPRHLSFPTLWPRTDARKSRVDSQIGRATLRCRVFLVPVRLAPEHVGTACHVLSLHEWEQVTCWKGGRMSLLDWTRLIHASCTDAPGYLRWAWHRAVQPDIARERGHRPRHQLPWCCLFHRNSPSQCSPNRASSCLQNWEAEESPKVMELICKWRTQGLGGHQAADGTQQRGRKPWRMSSPSTWRGWLYPLAVAFDRQLTSNGRRRRNFSRECLQVVRLFGTLLEGCTAQKRRRCVPRNKKTKV